MAVEHLKMLKRLLLIESLVFFFKIKDSMSISCHIRPNRTDRTL